MLIRLLYGRPLDTLLATWGVGLVLQQAARSIFGAPMSRSISPPWLNGGLEVTADFSCPTSGCSSSALVLVCLAVCVLLHDALAAGAAIRAVMQNREIAGAWACARLRVDCSTFALGSGLAGVAGCALTLHRPDWAALGTYYIVDAFMVVVLGGVGQLSAPSAPRSPSAASTRSFEFGTLRVGCQGARVRGRHRVPAVASLRAWWPRRAR